SSDLEIDDISVKVLSLNEEKEELLMTLFTEEFEGYEEGVFSNQKFFRGSRGAARHGRVINPPGGGQKSPLGRRRHLSIKKDNVNGNKLLRLEGSPDQKLILTKEFSLPEKYPFDTSDKTFKIVYNNDMVNTHMQSSRSGRQDEPAEAYNGPSSGGETPGTAGDGALEYTYYIHSFDGKLLAEYDQNGNCQRDYIYAGNRLIAEYRPQTNAYYYYNNDQ
ncbi:MAG: hypothetical protein GY757_42975, partial [bacterium]|nr:hypothetical protein [bacterium]